MNRLLISACAALALLATPVAFAKQEGKGNDKGHSEKQHGGKRKDKGGHKFEASESDEIRAFFKAHPEARSELPPGLAKKKKLPPGWRKKLERGKPVPDDIWEMRVPLPHEILVKLPPPPPGVVVFRVNDRIIRVIEKTHELLDELGLPHPPTPR